MILCLFFLYLFLWVSVGSSALLSQQHFYECYEKLLNWINYKDNIQEKDQNNKEEEQESSNNIKIDTIQKNSNEMNYKQNKKDFILEKLYFTILIFLSFSAFLINHITNRIKQIIF